MSYYVLLDPGTRAAELVTNSHGFPEAYDAYEDAKAEGDEYIRAKECRKFEVLGVCTDERNYII